MQAICVSLLDIFQKHWFSKVDVMSGHVGKSMEIVLNKILHCTRKLTALLCHEWFGAIASRFNNISMLTQ
jgi:hypothetical protein